VPSDGFEVVKQPPFPFLTIQEPEAGGKGETKYLIRFIMLTSGFENAARLLSSLPEN
jgi:hypothetical protein